MSVCCVRRMIVHVPLVVFFFVFEAHAASFFSAFAVVYVLKSVLFSFYSATYAQLYEWLAAQF